MGHEGWTAAGEKGQGGQESIVTTLMASGRRTGGKVG